MSEKAPQSKEYAKGFDELRDEAEHLLPTAEQAEALRSDEKDPREALAEARNEVQETARSATQLNPIEQLEASEKAAEPVQPTQINRELKQITLRRELQQIRRKLSAPQRSLSKVIHQPVVRVVSETAGKTVSRPSGLLGGGLVAFVGSTSYLYIAKHLGFRYNYLVFLLLFFGGFAVGLALELIVHMATASRRHAVD